MGEGKAGRGKRRTRDQQKEEMNELEARRGERRSKKRNGG